MHLPVYTTLTSVRLQNFQPPHQHYYEAPHGVHVYLWDNPWLRARCEDAGDKLLEVWEPDTSNWRTTLAQHLVVIADKQVPTVFLQIGRAHV